MICLGREEPGAKSVRMGKVGPYGVLSDRKRSESRQETMTAELRSRGTMYRKELVSKTGIGGVDKSASRIGVKNLGVYSDILHGSAEWWRYTAFCRMT